MYPSLIHIICDCSLILPIYFKLSHPHKCYLAVNKVWIRILPPLLKRQKVYRIISEYLNLQAKRWRFRKHELTPSLTETRYLNTEQTKDGVGITKNIAYIQ